MNVDIEQVKESLLEVVGELTETELDEAALDEPFAALGVDSLMALQLAVHLEREYGVRLSEEELAQMKNLRDILQVIDERAS
ncbi:acyl carrier protein [Brevibacillus humidisoli]|uniref:acyl carrier protein n=1 Tax=Brevibacillus humidisoli TaxID=2895522 RepID=UPI001E6277A1|nr:acyl carrier protein [Brevibacillus humidisoli]UFJ42433.1 acyl carrier protein [Brevibacillus humidisoli]